MLCSSSVQPSVLPAAQSAPTADGMRTSAENMQGVPGEVAVLLECTGTDAMLDQQRVDAFAQAVLEEGVVEDALLSLSAQQEKVQYVLCFRNVRVYSISSICCVPMMVFFLRFCWIPDF